MARDGWHTSDFLVVLEDVVHLLAVQGPVQGAGRLGVELESVTQLLQHRCLGGGFIQPATSDLLSQ